MNKKVILLSGDRSSGKDTLFNLLKEIDHNCVRHAFADELKKDLTPLLREQFGILPMSATGSDKEFLRPIFVAYGCAWREKEPLHWAKKVMGEISQTIQNNPQPLTHVVCDARFENEVSLFRDKFGGDMAHVNLTRVGSPGPTDEERKHSAAVSAMADYHILWGNDTPEQRALVAAKLVKWLEDSLTNPKAPLNA